MQKNNLRDNPDGTCNCRPLGKSCFFTDPYDEDGRCDCKCHFSKQNSGEKNPRCRECVKEKCSTCWYCHNALCDIHIQDEYGLYQTSRFFSKLDACVRSIISSAEERAVEDIRKALDDEACNAGDIVTGMVVSLSDIERVLSALKIRNEK